MPKSLMARRSPATPGRIGDFLVLAAAVAVTVAVAAAAGYVSFRHFVGLAVSLGEPTTQAYLYPATAEGMIIVAGLVMLYCSRRAQRVPWLAWICLTFGIAVAVTVNVVHGAARGIGGALLAALAPLAFVGSYELLMRLIRLVRVNAGRPRTEPPAPGRFGVPGAPLIVFRYVPVPQRVEVPVEVVVEKRVEVPVEVVVEKPIIPQDALDAARIAYEHSLANGRRPLGQRALAQRFNLEVRTAGEIIEQVRKEHAERAAEPSQQPADAAPSEAPSGAPAVTPPVTTGAAPAGPSQQPPAEPADEAPSEAPSVTAAEPAAEPSHHAPAAEPAEPAAETPSVTPGESADEPSQHRAAEAPADALGEDPAVTIPDGRAEHAAEPADTVTGGVR